MAVLTFANEATSAVAAPRMFKALLLDMDNLLLKIMPDIFKSIETLQGDGGPGTVRESTIAIGGTTKRIKHRIDALDEEKMTKSYTMTESEGDDLMAKFESIAYEIAVEATADGGCKVKTVSKFFPKEGAAEVSEDQLKAHKGNSEALFKAVEGYLLANPQAYA
uniref:Bet v I/Major latex protein domain-containing protein n=1 Tax=Kalanchoe fedtschenkoi TaxID=63787 RepID=A0A7N0UK26_KALFE